jgi:hypothetical protein
MFVLSGAAVGLFLFGRSRCLENYLVPREIEVLFIDVHGTVIMEPLMEQVCTMPLQVNIDKLTEMRLFGKCLFVCLVVLCTVLVEVILIGLQYNLKNI